MIDDEITLGADQSKAITSLAILKVNYDRQGLDYIDYFVPFVCEVLAAADKTGATQVLFLQHVIDALKPGGRCRMVIDEGVLFRTTETAFVQTKRKLLDDCDLWCIVSLPSGVFSSAGAGVKTNLLFFNKGGPTEPIWYYDLSDVRVTKKQPLTLLRFEEFFSLIPSRGDSDHSWTVTRGEIEARGFDLKAVNPNAKADVDTRTPEELLVEIEARHAEVAEAIAELRRLL
jgi:type I restriction enzyme M protein